MTPEERFAFAAERFISRDDSVRRVQATQRILVKDHDGEDVCHFTDAPIEQQCDLCREFDWSNKKRLITARSSAKMAMRKWWKRMHGAALNSTPEGQS